MDRLVDAGMYTVYAASVGVALTIGVGVLGALGMVVLVVAGS